MKNTIAKGKAGRRMPESWMQQQCVKWYRLWCPQFSKLLFSVPNGGFPKETTRQRMIREGMVAGVADLLLLVPNGGYHGLCIEMKQPNARLSKAQLEWSKAVKAQGYKYEVCCSLVDFMLVVKCYLKVIN